MAIELDIKILVVQEPWVIKCNKEYRSINHPSFKQVLPNYGAFRPRTLFYVSQDLRANLAQILPKDPNYVIINIFNF